MKTNPRFPCSATWGAALLATLLAAGLFPACSSKPKPARSEVAATKLDELQTKVREVVKDETRAEKVITLLKEMQALVTAQSEALAAHDKRIEALLADYRTSDALLKDEFAQFNAGRNERAQRAIEIAGQMRAATTAEEWDGLDKARKNALKAVTDAARQN